ncbi:MAG: signal peptidase I [Clostridia bacterium]|nr:signal peptidase I [Clostridia bacterium]
MKKDKLIKRPSMEELQEELNRVKHKKTYNSVLRSTIFTLITIAAVAVLVATLWMPVLRIYGSSMSPTTEDGDIVICVKSEKMNTGDIVAFYYNNKILVKRVIAKSGDWVNVSEDGTVFVNNEKIDEPYVSEKALGECDIEFPYQVPEKRIFVMGDHRSVSVDSRSTSVGCVAEEQIVGKIVYRVWPLNHISSIK